MLTGETGDRRREYESSLFLPLDFFVNPKLLPKILLIKKKKVQAPFLFMKIWEAISSTLNALRYTKSYPFFLVNYNLFSQHISRFYVTDGENVYSEGL